MEPARLAAVEFVAREDFSSTITPGLPEETRGTRHIPEHREASPEPQPGMCTRCLVPAPGAGVSRQEEGSGVFTVQKESSMKHLDAGHSHDNFWATIHVL